MDSAIAGPSGSNMMTRKELFDLMRSQNDLNFDSQLEFIEDYLISHKSYIEEQVTEIKHNFSRLRSEMKHRWIAAKYRSDLFEKNNEKWLNGVFELPILKTRPGRPKKSFQDVSERSKRRKTESIRLSDSPEKIIYAAQMELRAQGNKCASNILKEISENKDRAKEYRKSIDCDKVHAKEVEAKLSEALEELSAYYDSNHLRPNPSKTQVCAFHLDNKQARRELNIMWRGTQLQHFQAPKYLGITLNRTLSLKQHCINTKAKVSARNSILRKLTNRHWGADPQTLRTTALALCITASEYAAPVWNASKHAKHVDTAVNETARIVTGCLKPTPVQKLYPIIGIAPPHIRREVAADIERKKQQYDPRHSLHGHQPPNKRLRSRKSFLFRTKALEGPPERNRVERWREELGQNNTELVKEELASGSQCSFAVWRTLNRMRVGVPKCKTNMARWGILPDNEDVRCDCGAIQDPNHLLICPMLEQPCKMEDLFLGNDKAIAAANYWKMRI